MTSSEILNEPEYRILEKTVEDTLREEYFELLPSIRKTLYELEATIRHTLIPAMKSLEGHERLEICSRIKECDRAIDALKRREEGAIFDRACPGKYSLRTLKDLVGLRILVFPKQNIPQLEKLIVAKLPNWEADPIKIATEAFPKYSGFLDERSGVCAEYQIVPMLVGLFWEVEHDAIYKPSPDLKGLAPVMEPTTRKVYDALHDFEEELCRLIVKAKRKPTNRRD